MFEIRRLLEIVHADQKLYLVFEFLDMDLKRYMEQGNSNGSPITLEIVKASDFFDLIGSTDTRLNAPYALRTCDLCLATCPVLRSYLALISADTVGCRPAAEPREVMNIPWRRANIHRVT